MKRGIQLLKNPASIDTTIFILSNANTFFIDTIVQVRHSYAPSDCTDPALSSTVLAPIFSTKASKTASRPSSPTPPTFPTPIILTNLSSVDASHPMVHNTVAKLAAMTTCARVRPTPPFPFPLGISITRLDSDHKNTTTTTTGKELTEYLAVRSHFDRVIYVGDGTNDFCAVLRLRRYARSFIALCFMPLPRLSTHARNTAKISSFAADSGASNAKSPRKAPKALPRASNAPSNTGPARGRSRKNSNSTLERRRWVPPTDQYKRSWSSLSRLDAWIDHIAPISFHAS